MINEIGKCQVLLATLVVLILWLVAIEQYRDSLVRGEQHRERIGEVLEIGDRRY